MHVRATVLGNALGNSIVSKMSGPAPVVAAGSGEAGGNFDGSGYRNSAIDNLSLAELGEDSALSNNPGNSVYRPDEVLSPDELNDMQEVVVSADRIRPGEDAGLDLFAGLWQQSGRMTRDERAIVDRVGDAAGVNYQWRQQYGRNASWATEQIARGYETLTGAPAGSGQQLLALGYNGGPATWGERVAGSIIGGAQGTMEGVGRGTLGLLEFAGDAFGAAAYKATGASVFEPAYESYGATAAGLVNFVSGDPLSTVGGAIRDYGSRVALLNSADPLASGMIAAEPFGELLAPGAAFGAGARVGRVGRFASELETFGSSNILRSSNEFLGIERAFPALLENISGRRSVIFAQPGSSELRYLDYIGAEANVGGPDYTHILLRENPRKAAVLEEFLHGTQAKLGIVDRLGTRGFGSAETHVKDFMIRHQSMLGLSGEDVHILRQLRDGGL